MGEHDREMSPIAFYLKLLLEEWHIALVVLTQWQSKVEIFIGFRINLRMRSAEANRERGFLHHEGLRIFPTTAYISHIGYHVTTLMDGCDYEKGAIVGQSHCIDEIDFLPA